MDYSLLGKQIRHFRHEQRLTQAALAEAVDVSTSFIGHIERGSRKASLDTVLRISEALGVSLDCLVVSTKGNEHDGYSGEQLNRARELLLIALHLAD